MMTAVGRGRGNWGAKDLSAPLRRPGEASRASGGEEDIIMREIASLDINDNEKVEAIENQIKKFCVNREHLWKICQKMYESGAKDRSMVQKVVKFWKHLSSFEVSEVKLRSALMSTAQKDFEDREEIRKDDPERFLNAVALFGGIFHDVTLPGGGIFSVLIGPMIEYMLLLLKEGSRDRKLREAELEMLATQVNLNGMALYETKESLDAFNIQVRNTLASSLPSPQCHSWLLLILDLTLHDWSIQGFPDYLKTYYSEKLGEPFSQMAAADVSRSSVKSEVKNPVSRINADGPPVVTKKAEVRFSSENTPRNRDYSHEKPHQKNWPDGSGDHKERRQKPSYWGHDDRYEDAGDPGLGRGHGIPERGGGGRRGGGGGGGWANWRERGDNRSQKVDASGRRWNDENQSGHKAYVPSTTTEESWD